MGAAPETLDASPTFDHPDRLTVIGVVLFRAATCTAAPEILRRGGEQEEFFWNSQGQSSGHRSLDGIKVDFSYTADGFRRTETVDGLDKVYHYDPSVTPLAQIPGNSPRMSRRWIDMMPAICPTGG